MENNRRSKSNAITISEKSLQTAKDMEGVLNCVVNAATNINNPKELYTYARERYSALTKALCHTLDDSVIKMNYSKQLMIDAGTCYQDCENDYLAIFFEPEEKHIFIDDNPDISKRANNLRVSKYMGFFQFHEKACKLRFFRLTDELDCKEAVQELNDQAKVLNSIWNIEPYHLKMRPDFIDLYLRGEDFEPEINIITDCGIPTDDFLTEMIIKIMDALVGTLYSLNQNGNLFCRLTHPVQINNLRIGSYPSLNKTGGPLEQIVPVSVLQMMEKPVEKQSLAPSTTVKPKPSKPKPKRRR